jgi:predicted nucleic acid-binding protein
MRVVLDACVLVPKVLRQMLLGAAALEAFEPLWSARILEEWARATRRLPEGAEPAARRDIMTLRLAWPQAEVEVDEELVEQLSLPDPADRHVLAAAIAGKADVLLTLNRDDFPARALARHGVVLREPDGFLLELHAEGYDIAGVAEAVRERAEEAAGQKRLLRPLLKRAGLPRLGKALAGG